MPNWRFDTICVSAAVAEQVRDRFAVALRAVEKPRTGPTAVMQLLSATTESNWHRDDDLARAVALKHARYNGDRTGASCPTCRVWRWLPVEEEHVPIMASALDSTADLIASPEWFGDGWMSFRHLALRRGLAELLKRASPRNWDIRELELI